MYALCMQGTTLLIRNLTDDTIVSKLTTIKPANASAPLPFKGAWECSKAARLDLDQEGAQLTPSQAARALWSDPGPGSDERTPRCLLRDW